MTMSRVPKYLLLLLVAMPAVAVALYIYLYGANVVQGDDFAMAGLLLNGEDAQQLFAQHNEHRILFPRLIYLFVAWISSYNAVVIMYTSLALMCILYWVLAKYLKRHMGSRFTLLAVAVVGLILFQLSQWENWSWSFQLAFYCVMAFSCMSFYLADRAIASEKKGCAKKYVILASVCAVIASFSSIHGLLAWVAVFLPWAVIKRRAVLRDPLAYYWVILAIASWALYFHDYHTPAHHPKLAFLELLHSPIAAMKFYCSMFGSIFFENQDIAFVAGLLILAMSLIAIWQCCFIKKNECMLFPVALICFGLMFAGSILVGRFGFGSGGAFTSRYRTFSLMVPLGLLLHSLIRIAQVNDPVAGKQKQEYVYHWLATVQICLFTVLGFSGVISVAKAHGESKLIAEFNIATFETQPLSLLKSYYIFGPFLQQMEQIKERGLSIFHHNPYQTPESFLANPEKQIVTTAPVAAFDVNTVKFVQNNDDPYLEINSWAVDPLAQNTADSVYVCLGKQVFRTLYGGHRPDVAHVFKTPQYERSGFVRQISLRALMSGLQKVSLKVINKQRTGYYYLGNVGVNVAVSEDKSFAVVFPGDVQPLQLQDTTVLEKAKEEKSDSSVEFAHLLPSEVIVETGANDKKWLSINSWAIDPTTTDLPSAVYIRIGNVVHEAYCGTESREVATRFGKEELAYSGFFALVPISEVTDGSYRIYIIVVSKDNYQKFAHDTKLDLVVNGKDILIIE